MAYQKSKEEPFDPLNFIKELELETQQFFEKQKIEVDAYYGLSSN